MQALYDKKARQDLDWTGISTPPAIFSYLLYILKIYHSWLKLRTMMSLILHWDSARVDPICVHYTLLKESAEKGKWERHWEKRQTF
jgi:hypothetical protein